MSATSTTATYIVPEANLVDLRARVAVLAKRAAKLGLDFPVQIVSEVHDHDQTIEHKDPDDVTVVLYVEVRRYFAVAVESAVVKLDGWRFVASIAHTTEGNIVSVVPGQVCPVSYRSARSECDHCKTYRRRLETFVVAHDDGRTMQVGRNCLVDFTGRGARDAQALAEMAQLLAQFDAAYGSEAYDGNDGGGYAERLIQLESFMAIVAKLMRVKGWTSRSAAREFPGLTATATYAMDILIGTDQMARDLRHAVGPTLDQDKDLAAAAIAWAIGLGDSTDLNDYQYNLGSGPLWP